MTRFVYPRLPLAFAEARISEITMTLTNDGISGVQALAQAEHPRAAPVATGGRVASSEYIANVRAAVLKTVEPWWPGTVARPQAAAFDLALGHTLHEQLRIIPADAAHDEIWSFLTLVVFPDVAVSRFPDMHASRLIGTPRNVLRRTWFRQEVLGDLLHSTDRPLGEDELVGLFERSALARNRTLIRRLAVAVLAYDGPMARSEWARDLYKRVTFSTGPRLLDALSDTELDAIIHGTELASAPPYQQASASSAAPVSAAASTNTKKLVLPNSVSEGLAFVCGRHRLDLTVEALRTGRSSRFCSVRRSSAGPSKVSESRVKRVNR